MNIVDQRGYQKVQEGISKNWSRYRGEKQNWSLSWQSILTRKSYITHLGLTTLEERRIRGDMIEAYKILEGFNKVGNGTCLKLAPKGQRSETRGHSLKLAKPRHRTHKRNKFFTSRIVNKWNSLTECLISSTSVNMFKNRYDQLETVMLANGEEAPLMSSRLCCYYSYY